MVVNDVYETFFSFVNVTCYLRFQKCPVVWSMLHCHAKLANDENIEIFTK